MHIVVYRLRCASTGGCCTLALTLQFLQPEQQDYRMLSYGLCANCLWWQKKAHFTTNHEQEVCMFQSQLPVFDSEMVLLYLHGLLLTIDYPVLLAFRSQQVIVSAFQCSSPCTSFHTLIIHSKRGKTSFTHSAIFNHKNCTCTSTFR